MKIEDYGLKRLTAPLLAWYRDHARELPWREDATPYRVWVSEIMLQQTRAETVKPYFEKFVMRLPDVEALAGCSEEQLLKLWEGLGYYNRVRNMQAAARQIMEEYGGRLPMYYEELLKLKGIGHYTAGAIASIAYGIPVPAVDGNVLRVLSRAAADMRDIGKQSVRVNMEKQLLQIIPKDRAKDYNQALMELGATVCLPNGEPKCIECPWQDLCIAKKENLIRQIPVKSRPAARRVEKRTVFLIRSGENIMLRKRGQDGLLAGMYEFPNKEGHMALSEALAYAKGLNLAPLKIEPLADAKHIFSHVEWRMKGYMVWVESLDAEKEGLLPAEISDMKEHYPIPSAFAAYAGYL